MFQISVAVVFFVVCFVNIVYVSSNEISSTLDVDEPHEGEESQTETPDVGTDTGGLPDLIEIISEFLNGTGILIPRRNRTISG